MTDSIRLSLVGAVHVLHCEKTAEAEDKALRVEFRVRVGSCSDSSVWVTSIFHILSCAARARVELWLHTVGKHNQSVRVANITTTVTT